MAGPGLGRIIHGRGDKTYRNRIGSVLCTGVVLKNIKFTILSQIVPLVTLKKIVTHIAFLYL